MHPPATVRIIEHGPLDAGIQLDIRTQLEAIRYVIEVGEYLALGRIALLPMPLLL